MAGLRLAALAAALVAAAAAVVETPEVAFFEAVEAGDRKALSQLSWSVDDAVPAAAPRALQTDTVLTPNVPYSGSAASGSPAYFSVNVPQPFTSVVLTLMPAYGNPDLYASVGAGNSPDPSSAQYTATQSIGSDALSIPASDPAVRLYCPRSGRPGDVCLIRIAVVAAGPTGAGFTVLVSDGRPAQLSPGLILTGTTAAGSLNTYTYTPPVSTGSATGNVGIGQIAFTLTSLAGSPAVYVSSSRAGATQPTPNIPSSYCASYTPLDLVNTPASGTGSVPGNGGSAIIGRVAFTPGHPCYCGANNASAPTACVYYATVTASDFGSYSLSLTDTDSASAVAGASASSLLYDGVAQNNALEQGGVQYYDFTFVPAAVTAPQPAPLVTFTLSQFYGAPVSIYALVARAGAYNVPSRSNAEYTATPVDGTATITIARGDRFVASSCGGPASTAVCRIRLALVSGAAPRNTTATGGLRALQQAAASPSPILFAGFTLLARTDVGAIIDDGYPLLASVPQGRFTYFRFTHVAPGSTFVIAATGISGPVDVYVGLNSVPATVPPTTGNGGFIYRALSSVAGGGTSTLVLTPDDAPQLECTYPCTYTIGITPAAGSDGVVTFSLLLRVRGSSPSALLDGQPQLDAALAYDLNYYTVALPLLPPSGLATGAGAASVTVTLSPIGLTANINAAGNNATSAVQQAQQQAAAGAIMAQLYVRVGDGPIDVANPATYHYSSLVASDAGSEVALTVNGNDAAVAAICPVTGGASGAAAARSVCSLTVLVHTTTSAVYTVTSSTGNRLLQDGVTTTGRVPTGSAVYYTYFASAGASHVQLSLTPLAGTPVLLVSTTTRNPTTANAEYVAGGFSADTLTLDTANTACASTSASGACVFYLTVTTLEASGGSGSGGVAAFRLQGTSSQLTRMAMGAPVAGMARTGIFSYYGLFVPDTAEVRSGGIEIAAETVDGGFLSIVVGNDIATDGTGTPILPTATCTAAGCDSATFNHVQWAASGVQYRTRLLMKPADASYRVGTLYVIGVTSSAATAEFVLTATVGGTATTLVTGVAAEDALTAVNDTLYYRALVSDAVSSVTLQGMPYYGDIAIAVATDGTTSKPSASTPNARTVVARLTESYRVDLSAAQLAGCARDPITRFCSVYVAVTATGAPTAFSLVATVDGGAPAPIRLSEGRPARSAVLQGSYAYFYAPISNATRAARATVYVTLVELAGEADLYVNTNGRLPSRTSFGATTDAAVGTKLIAIGPDSPLYSSGMTTVTIAVFGATPAARFYITYTTSATVSSLSDGVASEGRAPVGGYAYYALPVAPNAGDVSVAVASLTGMSVLVASRWDNPRVNSGFRPTHAVGGASFTSAGNGLLLVPSGVAAGCPAVPAGSDPTDYSCTLIIGVWCDDSYRNPQACEFLLTPSTSAGNLARLAEGVPVRTVVATGTYRYFLYEAPKGNRNITFDVDLDAGAVQLVISTTYVPGVSPLSALPRIDDPSTYAYISYSDFPVIQIGQTADSFTTTTVDGNITTSTRLYVVGVYALEGPANVEVTAGASMTPLYLTPGETVAGNVLVTGTSLMFAVDTRDTSRDLVIALNALYGDAVVSISSPRSGGPIGANFVCQYVSKPTRGVNCTGAVWQASTDNNGNALIRIPFRRPCSSTATVPGACDPVLDFTAGTYLINVIATQDIAFSMSSLAASGHLRLLDGKPITVLQEATAEPQLLMYSVLAEASNPDLRITISTTAASASLTLYASYCTDDGFCSDVAEHPGPGVAYGNFSASSGARADVVISKSSPAYCRGDVNVPANGHRVCTYYFAIAPDTAYCAANGMAVCTAEVTMTATLMSPTATIVLDFAALNNQVNVLTAEAAPAKYSRYYLYVRDDGMLTNDVLLRLDACDTMAGFIVAFACENPSFYSLPAPTANVTVGGGLVPVGVNGAAFCANPRQPSTTNFQFQMSTAPDTAGGPGRSRAFISGTPTRLLHLSVTVPSATPQYETLKALYGESQYELSVTTGRAVFLKQPTLDGVGSLVVTTKASDSTSAWLSWTPPLVLNDSSAARFDYGTYAVNVTYKIYVAPKSFAVTAANATNTTLGFIGVQPSTACGLDRWQRFVAPKGAYGQVYTTKDNKFVLRNLVVAYPYEVNVVAVCDDDCLRANAAFYGFPVQQAGLSTQRVPYIVVTAKTQPPVETDLDLSDHASEALTGALAPLGIIATICLMAVVGYVVYRQQAAAKAAEAAKVAAEAGAPAPGAGGALFAGASGAVSPRTALVTRKNADNYVKPRTPAMRRSQGTNPAEQSIAETERLAATLQARIAAAPLPVAVAAPPAVTDYSAASLRAIQAAPVAAPPQAMVAPPAAAAAPPTWTATEDPTPSAARPATAVDAAGGQRRGRQAASALYGAQPQAAAPAPAAPAAPHHDEFTF